MSEGTLWLREEWAGQWLLCCDMVQSLQECQDMEGLVLCDWVVEWLALLTQTGLGLGLA